MPPCEPRRVPPARPAVTSGTQLVGPITYALTSDLAHVGTLLPPAVNPEADEASVRAVHIGHPPVHHAEHQQGCQEDEDEGPATKDQLSVLLPGTEQVSWGGRKFGGPGSFSTTLLHTNLQPPSHFHSHRPVETAPSSSPTAFNSFHGLF